MPHSIHPERLEMGNKISICLQSSGRDSANDLDKINKDCFYGVNCYPGASFLFLFLSLLCDHNTFSTGSMESFPKNAFFFLPWMKDNFPWEYSFSSISHTQHTKIPKIFSSLSCATFFSFGCTGCNTHLVLLQRQQKDNQLPSVNRKAEGSEKAFLCCVIASSSQFWASTFPRPSHLFYKSLKLIAPLVKKKKKKALTPLLSASSHPLIFCCGSFPSYELQQN